LFVTRSGILRRTLPVAIAMNELTINQDLKALTPVINLSTEYIYWYCQASNLKIRRKCSKDRSEERRVGRERRTWWEREHCARRRPHTRSKRDWSSDVCSSDLSFCYTQWDFTKNVACSNCYE